MNVEYKCTNNCIFLRTLGKIENLVYKILEDFKNNYFLSGKVESDFIYFYASKLETKPLASRKAGRNIFEDLHGDFDSVLKVLDYINHDTLLVFRRLRDRGLYQLESLITILALK